MLDIRSVSHAYGGTDVLRDVCLTVARGEFLSLVGPSGCGKSTLLRIVAGLLAQDRGSIAIDGRVVDDRSPKDRDIAMVFQNYALYPQLSVRRNIALPLRMRRLSLPQRLPLAAALHRGTREVRDGIEADVREIASLLSIEELLDRKPGQLSGGQRQRVALGRALVRRPKAFLMDEPLSNLDAELRVHMRAEIAQLHRRLGATVIYVTHDQVEAMTMSTRVAVMMEGRILQVARPQELYADPDSLRVAQFIGSPRLNVFEADCDAAGTVAIAGVRLSRVADFAYASGELRIGVRPEDMILHAAPLPGAIGLTVTHVENLGPDRLIHLARPDLEGQWVARVAADAPLAEPGDGVWLDIASSRKLLFQPDGRRVRPAIRSAAA